MIEYKVLLLTSPGDRWTTPVSAMTDITDFVLLEDGLSVETGRSNDQDLITPSRATITLLNEDNRFDPTNTLGPYFGYLNVNQPLAIQARESGTWRTIFYGYVASGFPVRDSAQDVNKVVVTCVDSLGVLATVPPAMSDFERMMGSTPNRRFYLPFSGGTPAGWVADGEFSSEPSLVENSEASALGITGRSTLRRNVRLFRTDESQGWAEFWVQYPNNSFDRMSNSVVILRESIGPSFSDEVQTAAARFAMALVPTGLIVMFRKGSTLVTMTKSDLEPHYFGGPRYVVLTWNPTFDSYAVYLDGKKMDMTTTVTGSADLGISHTTIGVMNAAGAEDPKLILQHLAVYSGTPDSPADRFRRSKLAGAGLPIRDHITSQLSGLASSGDAPQFLWAGASGGGMTVAYPITNEGAENVLELLNIYEQTVQGVFWANPTDTGSVITGADSQSFGQGSPLYTFTENDYLANRFEAGVDALAVENVSSVARKGGNAQVAKNTASISQIGERSLRSLEGLLLLSDHEAKALAEWRVHNFSKASWSISQLSFEVLTNSDISKFLTAPTQLIAVQRKGRTYYGHIVGAELRTEGLQTIVTIRISGSRFNPDASSWGDNWDAATWT